MKLEAIVHAGLSPASDSINASRSRLTAGRPAYAPSTDEE